MTDRDKLAEQLYYTDLSDEPHGLTCEAIKAVLDAAYPQVSTSDELSAFADAAVVVDRRGTACRVDVARLPGVADMLFYGGPVTVVWQP